jgi:hypothetical protein
MFKKFKQAFNKVTNKVMGVMAAAMVAVPALAVSASAEGELASALGSVESGLIMEAFYTVLPTVLTISLPILGAKIAINFLFSAVKGA